MFERVYSINIYNRRIFISTLRNAYLIFIVHALKKCTCFINQLNVTNDYKFISKTLKDAFN